MDPGKLDGTPVTTVAFGGQAACWGLLMSVNVAILQTVKNFNTKTFLILHALVLFLTPHVHEAEAGRVRSACPGKRSACSYNGSET